jgi:hypothetical protein
MNSSDILLDEDAPDEIVFHEDFHHTWFKNHAGEIVIVRDDLPLGVL